MAGKTCDMHERAFQGLKRTFMHVSVLLQAYFEKKSLSLLNENLTKIGGRRHETCIYVRCRA